MKMETFSDQVARITMSIDSRLDQVFKGIYTKNVLVTG